MRWTTGPSRRGRGLQRYFAEKRSPSTGPGRCWARRAAAGGHAMTEPRSVTPSVDCPLSRRVPSWWDRGRTVRSEARRPRSWPPRIRARRSIVSPPVKMARALTSPGKTMSRCRDTASRQGSRPNTRALPPSGTTLPSRIRVSLTFRHRWVRGIRAPRPRQPQGPSRPEPGSCRSPSGVRSDLDYRVHVGCHASASMRSSARAASS